MIKIIFFLTSLTIFYTPSLLSQGQNNIWCFGNNAGLDFNGTNASPLQSQVQAINNTASVSDPQGNLLFYTDGRTVWDRNHNIMPNGGGLKGGQYASNPVLVAPLPQSSSKFYIFTLEDQFGNRGLRYTVLDMSLNAGFGDVLSFSKNTLVVDSVSEGITSFLHQNGSDIWITVHKLNSTNYQSYLLNPNGLESVPVVTSIGSYYSEDDLGGYMKASSDSKKLISSRHSSLEIFDFNNASGTFSGYVDLEPLFVGVDEFDGVEFSPNDSVIYVVTFTEGSSYDRLFQLVIPTFQITLLNSNPLSLFGSLQLAADKKIYFAIPGQSHLGVIHYPNRLGVQCQFDEQDVELIQGTMCLAGLPLPILYSFTLDTSDYSSLGRDTLLCTGDTLLLEPNIPVNCDSIQYLWSNGSHLSQLVVDIPGVYWVEITSNCGTIKDSIHIYYEPCDAIVKYDLEGCSSNMNNGTNMDYSEFIPEYPADLNCAIIEATTVFRTPANENKHSCTPGVNGSIAMCISSELSCEYEEGNTASLAFEITLQPELDSVVKLTSFEFYERSPLQYDWINGSSGLNNYPQKFGIRILKNGAVILKQTDFISQRDWTFVKINFGNDTAFTVHQNSTFRFEVLPYCPVGNVSQVSAWDIDAIRVSGRCEREVKSNKIYGHITNMKGVCMSGVEVHLAMDSLFQHYHTEYTDSTGYYQFDDLEAGQAYFVRGYKNDDILNGVTIQDLFEIQKYLLGLFRFNGFDQYIAADINNSGQISVMDLVHLRKVLFGFLNRFPNNYSWRFISKDQVIEPLSLSALTDFNIVFLIEQESHRLDLLGVKTGDINRDAIPD